jgi:DNA polymerase III epsilon subunit-like protein
MNIIILDTETTGLPQPSVVPLEVQPKIIEIGALYIDSTSNEITRTINQLFDPGEVYNDKTKETTRELPLIITAITGLTIEKLNGQPTFNDFLPVLSTFFIGADVLIMHNAQFDVKMINLEMSRIKAIGFPYPPSIICTVQEYKAMMGKWPKLTELYTKIMGKPLAQSHRALDDCIALHEILMVDKFFEKIKNE